MDKEDTQLSAIVNHYKCIIDIIEMNHISVRIIVQKQQMRPGRSLKCGMKPVGRIWQRRTDALAPAGRSRRYATPHPEQDKIFLGHCIFMSQPLIFSHTKGPSLQTLPCAKPDSLPSAVPYQYLRMPRLPPTLLRQAHGISPHLRTLLPACRDIESARHELRWIREHVRSSPSPSSASSRGHNAQLRTISSSFARDVEELKVAHLCARRGRGEPLQYVLGTQPFGPLEIQCASGVLIPRPETEAWATYLADVLARHYRGRVDNQGQDHHPIVLDLCTGTGCIALLLHERLRRLGLPHVRAAGLDVSPAAVTLARHNRDANVRAGRLSLLSRPDDIVFQQADLFAPDTLARRLGVPPGRAGVDVLVSNPPYISDDGFARGTGRSVRNYEPALALVPAGPKMRAAAAELGCALEDVFYARLFDVARELRPDFVLFEVGDLEQARRVVKMVARMGSGQDFGCEIWRDEPDAEGSEEVYDMGPELGLATIRGEGHGRSVFVYRKSKS